MNGGTFDSKVAITPRSDAPHKNPGTGYAKDTFDSILYKETKGQNNRPYKNMVFNAIVAYSVTISYETFKKKYDKEFIEYVTKYSPELQGSSQKSKQPRISELVVYVPELCGCLPQPRTQKFYTKIKELTSKNKNPIENLKSEIRSGKDKEVLLDLEKIERYPKVYAPLTTAKDYKPLSRVRVQFPYNYDFSYGLLIGD